MERFCHNYGDVKISLFSIKPKGKLLTAFCLVSGLFILRGEENISHMPKPMSFSTKLIYRA